MHPEERPLAFRLVADVIAGMRGGRKGVVLVVIHDQARRGNHESVDDAKLVGPQRGPGLCELADRGGEETLQARPVESGGRVLR